MKNFFTALATSIVVTILALALHGTGTASNPTPSPSNAPTLGSTVETIRVLFQQGFDTASGVTIGGPMTHNKTLSTSTVATTGVILPASTFATYATILYSPLVANTNLYLPASTTFPYTFLPKAGDRTSFMLFNATTTSGILLGLVPGTGSLVAVSSSTPAITASTSPGVGSMVTIIRKPNTDLLFQVAPFK